MKSAAAAAVLALLAGSAAAQVADLTAAYDAARAAAAVKPATPAKPAGASKTAAKAAQSSCPGARELETAFELTVTPAYGAPAAYRFEYAGCSQAERNDYLPPYTERSYESKDGYSLVIVTNDGESASEVLLAKGKDWVGDERGVANAALASGDPVALAKDDLKDAAFLAGKATLRDAARPLYPQLARCEAADWSKEAVGAPVREGGKPETGFSRGGPSLVLLTKTSAYYYHEDCDICAEITRCDLATGALSSVVRGHSAGCSDLKPFSTDAVFSACR